MSLVKKWFLKNYRENIGLRFCGPDFIMSGISFRVLEFEKFFSRS